ncbi:hypothetical protein OQY15_04665 [Pedobacter sp. MC2016-15]|uniref:hypothetical protein n=1 Tax=Pedobacter sp. MC2016-15 TaxID=2994473 RepID=UPI002247867B|nr:hypothetical protein [Pedobacter sp. MC2016-15]MCX2478370.1 hypothetical protein [Pedobacter sp. MC2016-15]
MNSQIFPEDIRVEFPRSLREDNPIGTRFKADLKVSQKSNKSNGFPIGPPYLVVDVKTIKIVEDFVPEIRLKAVRLKTASYRVYMYVKDNTLESPILAASRIWHKNMRKLE